MGGWVQGFGRWWLWHEGLEFPLRSPILLTLSGSIDGSPDCPPREWQRRHWFSACNRAVSFWALAPRLTAKSSIPSHPSLREMPLDST